MLYHLLDIFQNLVRFDKCTDRGFQLPHFRQTFLRIRRRKGYIEKTKRKFSPYHFNFRKHFGLTHLFIMGMIAVDDFLNKF